MRRVVVTGLGLVTPLGVGADFVWNRLLAGDSGLVRLSPDVAPDIAAQVAGVVPEGPEAGQFDIDRVVSSKDQKKMDRFIGFALAAADEALAQAAWSPIGEVGRLSTATIVGSGIGGFPALAQAVRTTDARGARRLSPFTVPSFLANLASGWISIRHGFTGPIGAPVTACAAGVQAIGDAARLIRNHEADVAVCGGSEAAIHHVSLGGFAASRALSTAFNDDPERASRPFDAGRDGFVMGEGAGVLVIEALDHALARGARPLAELVGYGTSADAYHLTAGPEDGAGALRAMRAALKQAGVSPDQVGHLNAHATSTPVGDAGELAAIRTLFGAAGGPAISATKASTGHLLGGAGGMEAVFTVLALHRGMLPPTKNLDAPDPLTEGLDIVTSARATQVDLALSNGFGFGGVNASVLFRRWSDVEHSASA